MKHSKHKLTIELVPHTVWHSNLRSAVPEIWDEIRHTSYRLAWNRCEICGDTGKNQGYEHDVECHEIWEYIDETKTQNLVGIVSLCPHCHKVKHAGLAGVNGELDIVYKQLCKVNDMSWREAIKYLHKAEGVWSKRNLHVWETNIDYIYKYLRDNNPINDFMNKF